MSTWTPAALDRFAGDELRIASRRPDGSLRPGIIIWCVRVDDDLYVRSAYGPGNGWYRRAVASGDGAITAGGATVEVDFAEPVHDAAAIDAAYRAKYGRFTGIVDSVVGEPAASATLRLVPRR